MNADRPNVNEDEQTQKDQFMHGDHKGEDVVRDALYPPVHRMKRMTCKWCW